jgi:hypothetical protein
MSAGAVSPALDQALGVLRRDKKGGRPVRVQLPDGSRIHGELVEVTDTALSLLPRDTKAPRSVPLREIRVLWIADVRRNRYQIFMAVAGLAGVGAAVAAGRLLEGPGWIAMVLGVAAVLAVLAIGWTVAPVRRWLVAWLRVYDEGHERAS